LALSIAFRIVNNLRMQAVKATLAGLPVCRLAASAGKTL
jgi:hypothetical protein